MVAATRTLMLLCSRSAQQPDNFVNFSYLISTNISLQIPHSEISNTAPNSSHYLQNLVIIASFKMLKWRSTIILWARYSDASKLAVWVFLSDSEPDLTTSGSSRLHTLTLERSFSIWEIPKPHLDHTIQVSTLILLGNTYCPFITEPDVSNYLIFSSVLVRNSIPRLFLRHAYTLHITITYMLC